MPRNWEKFMSGPFVPSRERLHVSINSKGLIQFNRRTFEALGKPDAVVLYFERATKVMGMAASHTQAREAFPVSFRGGYYWSINAIPFCRNFEIRVEGTHAFFDPELDDQKVLQLDLRTMKRIYGGRGRRKVDVTT
ncbi:MAG: hypothetical protein ABJA02_16230 [Acidobacteriota bacterium]